METKTEFLVGTIMSAVATAGVAVTAIVSAEDTKRAMRKLEAAQKEKGSALTKKETFKAVWKCYIPTAITVVLTAGLCFGSNLVNKDAAGKVKATAASLLGVAGTKLSEAKEKLFDQRVEQQKEIIEQEPDDGQVLFYMDEMDGFFHAKPIDVLNSIAYMNSDYAEDGIARLSDLLERFKADQPIPKEAYNMGWFADYIFETDVCSWNGQYYSTFISPSFQLIKLNKDADAISGDEINNIPEAQECLIGIPEIPNDGDLYCVRVQYSWCHQPVSVDEMIQMSIDNSDMELPDLGLFGRTK